MYANARKYGLTGTDAMVFEALVYLCRSTGEWKGSYTTLARFSCCGGKMTASRCLQRLIDRGLASQNETGAYQIETEKSQNDTKSKEERTKEERNKERNNINKSQPANISPVREPSDSWLAGFNKFWDSFSPSGEYNRRKKACKELWQKMPKDWQELAKVRASDHPTQPNPLFWLRDEEYLRVGSKNQEAPAQPYWLTGEEQDECLKAGIILVVCQIPQTNRYGTVTKEDAEKFGLTIHHQM